MPLNVQFIGLLHLEMVASCLFLQLKVEEQNFCVLVKTDHFNIFTLETSLV